MELRFERTFSENGRRDFQGPRIDLEWNQDLGWMRLSLEYEYEARRSNDPNKNLGGHLVILGAQVLR